MTITVNRLSPDPQVCGHDVEDDFEGLSTSVKANSAAVDVAFDATTAEESSGTEIKAGDKQGRVGSREIWNLSRRWVLRATGILAFLALWEFGPLYLAGPDTRVFLPPLHEVLQAWGSLYQTGSIQEHVIASLQRSGIGFAIALVSGVGLGLLIAWYPAINDLLGPVLVLFNNTAALALLPVFTLLLGIGEESKVSIVAYAAIFPILLNTISGVKSVDPLLIRAARSLGQNSFQLFYKVILPSAVPTIFAGIRMAGTTSILVLIAAEMVGAKAGLGFLIVSAQTSFLIPDMYAGILTVAMLGLIINYVLIAVERYFSGWRVAASAVAR